MEHVDSQAQTIPPKADSHDYFFYSALDSVSATLHTHVSHTISLCNMFCDVPMSKRQTGIACLRQQIGLWLPIWANANRLCNDHLLWRVLCMRHLKAAFLELCALWTVETRSRTHSGYRTRTSWHAGRCGWLLSGLELICVTLPSSVFNWVNLPVYSGLF